MRLVIILILIIKSPLVCGQNLEKTYVLANSLYENKSYELAVDAYKRVLFFDSEGKYRNTIYPNIADCLFKSKEYEESANYFELAYFGTEDSVLKNHYILKKVSSYLILQQIDFAEAEILNLNDELNIEQLKEKAIFGGIISFAKSDFYESEKIFKTLAPAKNRARCPCRDTRAAQDRGPCRKSRARRSCDRAQRASRRHESAGSKAGSPRRSRD